MAVVGAVDLTELILYQAHQTPAVVGAAEVADLHRAKRLLLWVALV